MPTATTSRSLLTSIEIVGFRGIKSGQFADLMPLSILVGPNGCGKSTVLEAIDIGTGLRPDSSLNECVQRRGGREKRWIIYGGENRSLIVVKTCEAVDAITAIEQHGNDPNHLHVKREFRNAQNPDIVEIGGTLPCAVLVDADITNRSNPNHLQQLYTKAVEFGRREFAQELVRQVVQGAQGIEILTEGGAPIIYVVFPTGSVPLSLVGDGIQRVFRIALELASRREGIVLLEEPEVFQHPGTIRQTARVILASVRRGMQVILSTHSLELIDAVLDQATQGELDLTCVYRLQLDQGQLHVSRLNGADAKFARKQIEDDLR